MKRNITFAILALASMAMSTARADGYGTLIFKSVNGETYSVNTKDLEIYFKDGVLSFNNSEQNFQVASLVSMEFADGSSGVEGVLTVTDGPIEVFTLDGVKTGEYASLTEAYSSLQAGIYAVRCSDGNTFKIKVGK